MSTKATISYYCEGGKYYHLYRECLLNDVYLDINFEISGEKNTLTIPIPNGAFQQMVDDWTDSSFGRNYSEPPTHAED